LDAFNTIQAYRTAAVVTLDISKFFESIDHELLRQKWCGLLGLSEKGAARIPVYTTAFKEMPRQLCSNVEFREKICGKGGKHPTLIEPHPDNFGIPQGSPISDILANLYLIDFDTALKAYVEPLGGIFYRYSDDIIIILPGDETHAFAARDFAMNEIKNHGSQIVIKKTKTAVLKYFPGLKGQDFTKLDGEQGENGLEYLGFRYDGRFAFLRDTTLSRLYRKLTKSIRAEAYTLVRRYPGKSRAFIESQFNPSEFMQRYGRVADFDNGATYESWTFWTYAKRAIQTFGPLGNPIGKQLRNYRRIVRTRINHEIGKALS
jgi:hypothetical protein